MRVTDGINEYKKGRFDNYIIKSCSSNVVFFRMVNDNCCNGKIVAIFMPMYYVSMTQDLDFKFTILGVRNILLHHPFINSHLIIYNP